MARKKTNVNDDLGKLVVEYYNLDTEIKALTTKKDPLNKMIKLEMRKRGLAKFSVEDIVATCTTQTKLKYIDDPAVKTLKDLGHYGAIKEIIDADAVKALIVTGQIKEDLLTAYTEVRQIDVLAVKKE